MRQAIANADVGDDQYGEDPSVNRLQEEVAALLGTEAALFFPSGTMSNQVALRTLTRPGDDVLVPAGAHILMHETGGAAANSGVQLTSIGEGGIFDGGDVARAANPAGHLVYPPTTLLVVENTHNRAGGIVFPPELLARAMAAARERGLGLFLDGARLLNAAVASGRPPRELTAGFDLVSLSLSKGLGAPVGSMLAGSAALIVRALRYRRMAGGAMRQAGILAAAGSYALANSVDRLADDHANARLLAEGLDQAANVEIDLASVQTNIVVFSLANRAGVRDAAAFVESCRARGVLLNVFGPRTVRAVTHLDVDTDACRQAAGIMREVAEGR